MPNIKYMLFEIEKKKEIKKLFESIICLCVEGVEVMGRTELLAAITRDAAKGFNLCSKP